MYCEMSEQKSFFAANIVFLLKYASEVKNVSRIKVLV